MRKTVIIALLFACVLLSSCSNNMLNTSIKILPTATEKVSDVIQPVKIGGISGNMINGGLVDGNDDIIVYSWEHQLIEVNTDGTNKKILANDEAQCICILNDWIYYRKVGATSDPINGIYKIKKDGSQKTQITSDTTQYIYVVGDWLYYINWSYTTDICRIKTDGINRETLYVGQYDCLSTDGSYLYFDDFGKDIYIQAPMNGGAYSILIPSVDEMPQVSNGWVYYVDGTDYECYRIKTDGTGKEPYVTTRYEDCFLATDRFNFYGWMKVDNYTGKESRFFTENGTDRWIAGNNIVYLERVYDPNNTDRYQSPISETLFAKNIFGGQPIILEHIE